MKLKIISVESIGDLARERVVLQVEESIDLGRYAVFRCRRSANGAPAAYAFSGGFWFAKKTAEAKDLVIVYSKAGAPSEKKSEDGLNTSHFFYWGSAEALWIGSGMPVCVETSSWSFQKPAAPDP